MKIIKINEEINENKIKGIYFPLKYEQIKVNNKLKRIINIKYIFLFYFIMIFLIFKSYFYNKNTKHILLKSFGKYIDDCKKFKIYNRKKFKNIIPHFSICISALNMEKYIKKNIISIINQSFRDLEIIIVDDNSKDNTKKIIKEMQIEDGRITIINHSQNLGVYRSRIESILNAKGKFIILMDPDDLYLNQNLFQELYNYNLINNLDIIEFSVYHQIDGKRKILYPNNHFENHFHNFSKQIIYQPELSNLLYYRPRTKQYSYTICRNIWNKIIRKEVFLKMHKYIGKYYYSQFVITADDMAMNIISYQFANNYSNIDLPGYMYNIRKVSMSNGDGGIKLTKIRCINYFMYFNIFYRYLKDFYKDRNFLFWEMKNLNNFIINIKHYNINNYIPKVKIFIKTILNDKYLTQDFKNYLIDLLKHFKK